MADARETPEGIEAAIAKGRERIQALAKSDGSSAWMLTVLGIGERLVEHGYEAEPRVIYFTVGAVPEEEWSAMIERGRRNGWDVYA